MSISPAGNNVAFVGASNGIRRVYLRALDSSEAMPMAGTENAYCTPTYSPDGQWLAYFDPTSFEMKKISIRGGPPVTLAKIPGGVLGATWGTDGTIIYARNTGGYLEKVSSSGGTPARLTQVNSAAGETSHRWPTLLPDGKALLFVIHKGPRPEDAQIVAQQLSSGQRRLVLQGGTFPQYVPTGHLVYVHGKTLMAVPFDVQALQVKGQPAVVAEDVQESGTGAGELGVSPQGSLVYIPAAQTARLNLVWVSRDGREQPIAAPARPYYAPRLSPDGKKLAVNIDEEGGQIWLYDFDRETLSRFTFQGDSNEDAVWTPDGKRIAFHSGEPVANIFWQPADGSGGPERLTTSEHQQAPESWSPDGQLLAFDELDPTTGRDVGVLRLSGRKQQSFLRTQADECAARFSSDGRWLAYGSNESGRSEAYVQPYPGPGRKWQVSTEGGAEPIWNPNGRELFYRNGSKMMAVEITRQPDFSIGRARVLFDGGYVVPTGGYPRPNYDVSPDGQRFLMIKESPPQLNVVLNWFEELKRRVPTGK